ncbi:hypothetical protein D1H44_11480 [Escherichia coli]|nr:hypothetical protein [Escherichia coli]
MRNFSKLEIYRLMHDDNCAGLIIADPDTYVYQRLNDIVCGQAKVMSGNIHWRSVIIPLWTSFIALS